MNVSSTALLVLSLIASKLGPALAAAEAEIDPLGQVRELKGNSKAAEADKRDLKPGAKSTKATTASPTAAPTMAPTGAPTNPPSALLTEDSFLEGRTAGADAEKNDEGPQLIFGGRPVVPGEYPYYVSLGTCGGVHIGPRVVLTAAHCVDDGEFAWMVGQEVTVGAVINPDLDPNANDGSVRATVAEQVTHPRWSQQRPPGGGALDTLGAINDFALLLLERPVQANVNSNVVLAMRDDEDDIAPGTALKAVGLGDTGAGLPLSLLEADVITISDDECRSNAAPLTDFDVTFCVEGATPGEGTCGGDSGGPYVKPEGNTHILVGVTSFGPACGVDPSSVAQIPGNEDGFGWIQSVVCGEFQFGEDSSVCNCESDCDCADGLSCVCEEAPDGRRFLEAMEGEYKVLPNDKTDKEGEQFNFHKSSNRRGRKLSSKSSSSSGKGGKSCKSVKCNKSSKSGEFISVCR